MGTEFGWSEEFERWPGPFPARLEHRARRRMCPLYTAKALDDPHRRQCTNYLKVSGLRLCLLPNFGRHRTISVFGVRLRLFAFEPCLSSSATSPTWWHDRSQRSRCHPHRALQHRLGAT